MQIVFDGLRGGSPVRTGQAGRLLSLGILRITRICSSVRAPRRTPLHVKDALFAAEEAI